MKQPTLFDAPATHRPTRVDRCATGAHLRAQQRRVLRAVAALTNATAWEVWCFLSHNPRAPQQNVIAKRLGELRELGLVRETGATRPGSSKRSLLVFEATEAGRSAA